MPPVYFLGAGATKADHPAAPLGDELLHQILVSRRGDVELFDFLEGIYDAEQLTQLRREPSGHASTM